MDSDVKDSFIAVHFDNDHLMGPAFLIGTGPEQQNTLQWTAKFSLVYSCSETSSRLSASNQWRRHGVDMSTPLLSESVLGIYAYLPYLVSCFFSGGGG